MPLQFETVAIPVVKGVDLRTAARLVEPPALLQAVNARFNGKGSQKRYGHRAAKALTGAYAPNQGAYNISPATLTAYGEKLVDSEWLYGWGIIVEDDSDDNAVSPYPEPGYLFSGFTRDQEKVAWTGHSLISYAPSQDHQRNASHIQPACLPVLRSELIAKRAAAQFSPDCADNGKVRVVVWQNAEGDGATAVYYSVYDSVTGAQLVDAQALAIVEPFAPRLFSLGNWFHIICYSQDIDELKVFSFSSVRPTTVTARTLTTTTSPFFDIYKQDETRCAVLYNVDGTGIALDWIGLTGERPEGESPVTLDLDAEDDILNVAVAVHPTTNSVGIAFFTGDDSDTPSSIMAAVFTRDGIDVSSGLITVSSAYEESNGADQLTIAPRYLLNGTEEEYDIYASWLDSTVTDNMRMQSWKLDRTEATETATIYHQTLASHAFRVGHRTFVWTGHSNTTLQKTWFLLDSSLKPVGHLNFGTAAVGDTDTAVLGTLATVNFKQTGAAKDQAVFHLALGYRQRVPSTDDQTGLYAENSIQFVELDFLPKLQSVQAGRTTYIAGAQVWAYDGRELVEAGFHIAPEVTLEESTTVPESPLGTYGAGLTTGGTYSYRVDLCYRNAQNEEVRSHSFITQHTLTDLNDIITLSIKTCLTRRDNAYFLIFRNSMQDGAPTSTWNLLNSRDPSAPDYLVNDQTVNFVTYVDSGGIGVAPVSNDDILERELHPGNSQTYMHPFAAPACEVIAAGHDRVWVAGGELGPGELYPSRLFGPGETPAWNGNLAVQIDRNEAPITAIGFVGEITAVFRERLTYVLDGDGPDNQGNGFWPPARLALADTGALSQQGVALCSAGLLFQSPAGFRLLGAGGGLQPIGEAVDDLAEGFEVSSAVCLARESEVRWYGPTGAIVYNYGTDSWSTWTCGAAAALSSASDTAVTLVRQDGWFWTETQDYYRDGASPYNHLIQIPWLHAGSLGDFQRLRRFAGFGTWDPADGEHNVHVEISYDERDFHEEYWDWTVPDDTQNTDTWGSSTWGGGVWADTSSTFWARDSVWRWRRMPRKQKCSVFSITISDNFTDGPGFVLTALGLELARKSGLDRIAVPGGTNVSR